MTLVPTPFRPQPRPAGAGPRPEQPVALTEEAGPQVWGDMTVEVALSVMAGARVGHLLVCDDDGRRTGLVTRARLTAVQSSTGYTDRLRLRDVIDGDGHLALAG